MRAWLTFSLPFLFYYEPISLFTCEQDPCETESNFLVSLMWKTSCDIPISTSPVSILKGNGYSQYGLYTYYEICMFSLCAVIVWWSDITIKLQKIISFLSF